MWSGAGDRRAIPGCHLDTDPGTGRAETDMRPPGAAWHSLTLPVGVGAGQSCLDLGTKTKKSAKLFSFYKVQCISCPAAHADMRTPGLHRKL